MKEFHYTKVISRNELVDVLQGIRNFLGLELRGYSKSIDKGISDLLSLAKLKGKIKWYRISVNELVTGAIMITIYGEYL